MAGGRRQGSKNVYENILGCQRHLVQKTSVLNKNRIAHIRKTIMTSPIVNLDFSKFPSGSFAVVFTPRVAKDARAELAKLAPHAHNLTITTETLDGVRATVPAWNAFNDMLDLLFASGSLTLKVFTNQSKGVAEREIVKKLAGRLGSELTKLTPYTTLKKVFAIHIDLAPEAGTMRVITPSSDVQTLSTLHMIVCTTCKSVGVQLDRSTLEDLNNDLRRLNSMGVFHSDVHLGNIMQRMDGRACLIDFGSVFIDDAVAPDEVPYKRGRFPHPFVHAFFTGTHPRIESQTLAIALMQHVGHFAYIFMDARKTEPAFVRYLLHKKDMYNLAYTWWQHRPMNGNGFLGCFDRPSVKDDTIQHINVKPSKRDEERGGDVRYRALFKHNLANDLLAEMLYFDRPDYQEFAHNYIFSYCGGGGKLNKLQKKPSYVLLKSTQRVHRVRLDDRGRKCVLSQGRLVLLSSIRGQYRHVTRPTTAKLDKI